MGMAGLADEPLAWVSDPLAEALEVDSALAEALEALVDSALAEALEELELFALAEALAEAVAEADTLEVALWLLSGFFGEDPQAARPSRPARLRDSTAIDFFTADFSFRHASRHHRDAVYKRGW